MSAHHAQMDKDRLIQVFNLGFRRGANDRAAIGLSCCQEPSQSLRQPPVPPPAPAECNKAERKAWNDGYEMGYQIGASDAELASVEAPGACGMVSGMGEEILQMIGLFKFESEDEWKL